MLIASSNSAWNIKHEMRSAKCGMLDKSCKNASGLSKCVSGLFLKCSFIETNSSSVARCNKCSNLGHVKFGKFLWNVCKNFNFNIILPVRKSVATLPS